MRLEWKLREKKEKVSLKPQDSSKRGESKNTARSKSSEDLKLKNSKSNRDSKERLEPKKLDKSI